METKIKEYDSVKLEELKLKIQDKRDKLMTELVVAIFNGANESVHLLKEKIAQCNAELRLIKHIETGMTEEFMIC